MKAKEKGSVSSSFLNSEGKKKKKKITLETFSQSSCF